MDYRLSPSEQTILFYLFEYGPAHGYQIHRDLKKDPKKKLSDKSVYTALNALAKSHVIQQRETANKPRPGQPLKQYMLTVKGFYICILKYQTSIPCPTLDDVHWLNFLPLLFQRWKLIQTHGLSENILEAIKKIVNRCAEHLFSNIESGISSKIIIGTCEKLVTEQLVSSFGLEAEQSSRNAWYGVLSKDPMLLRMVKEQYQTSHDMYKMLLHRYEQHIQILDILNTNDPNWKAISEIDELFEKPLVYSQYKT